MINEFRKIAKRIFALVSEMPVQVFIRIKKGALIRFTNNGIHQNGFQDLFSYTLRTLGEKGPVWVESNDHSEAGIRSALDRLRLASEMPAISRTKRRGESRKIDRLHFFKVKEHFTLQPEKVPKMAARAIEKAVRLIRQRQASANGYYSGYERFFYLADSAGLEVFHPTTAIRFGVTATKGAGKGYHSFYHPDPKRLKVLEVVEEALRLAESASAGEVSVEPGEYECVFSPRALLEFLEPLRRHFDARLCADGKSVFSGLLGKEIFSKALTLSDDFRSPGQFGVPFDAEGSPRKGAVLVERGVLKGLLGEGHSTRGWSEHPFDPQNLVMGRGTHSREEIFRRIRRGLFINKIWYHTLVRESAMEVTGLATAGSVYIERGRIRGQVVRLRYHDSIFSILRSVLGVSRERHLLKDGEMGAALLPYLWVGRFKVV